jgi:hypothetical protein
VARRVGAAGKAFVNAPLYADAIEFFCMLRDLREPLSKRPATAELMDWLEALRLQGNNSATRSLRDQPDCGARCLNTLLKGKDDLERGRQLYADWLGKRSA